MLVGDFDGIVVIPQERLDEVVAAAREIEDAEDHIRDSIRNGMSLLDARTQFNYHRSSRGVRSSQPARRLDTRIDGPR